MSILDRLEEIRERERLNKKQFETIIGKSSDYIGTLAKTNSIPGTDVILKVSKNFPKYNLNWVLEGEGEMLKSTEDPTETVTGEVAKDQAGNYVSLESVRNEIRADLKIILEGMTDNFEVINEGMIRLLKGNDKVLEFIKDMDNVKIKETATKLREFLAADKDKQSTT